MTLKLILFASLFCASHSFATPVKENQKIKVKIDVKKHTLANGLTILLHEDKSAPLVSYHTWFRVGSKDEEIGYTGIAHLFEHMMFKGAKRYDGKTFDRLLAANGASHNAFTTRDFTAYHATLPSHKLELIIDLESDRMANLQISEANLKSEREVVKEERRYRVEDSPMGLLSEATYSTVFRQHPYRWPIIGWMADLDRITVEKCREFFTKYYSPSNAVIVVAGDFASDEALRLIQKYYNGIPSHPFVAKKLPEEPPQTSMRQRNVSKQVQNESISIAFKTVPAGHPDYYDLDILAGVFGEGSSSRLYKKLVYDQQVASAVGVQHSGAMGPGVFQVLMQLKPGGSHDQALQTAYSQMWDLRNKLVTPKEMEKARNQVMRNYVDALRTVNGKAMALAYNEIVLGSYEFLFKDLDHYFNVTAESLRKVAAKYLNTNQRNLIVVARFAPTAPAPQEPEAKKDE
ncbi:MAG: M16 family metallopeptidase [Bdellovibrionales bacterium]